MISFSEINGIFYVCFNLLSCSWRVSFSSACFLFMFGSMIPHHPIHHPHRLVQLSCREMMTLGNRSSVIGLLLWILVCALHVGDAVLSLLLDLSFPDRQSFVLQDSHLWIVPPKLSEPPVLSDPLLL